MKQLINGFSLKHFATFVMLCLVQTIVWAQDNGGSGTTSSSGSSEGGSSSSITKTSITTTSDTWYAQPWVWVVGAVVLILLLVALLRGNSGTAVASRTDRVTVTKTSSTDADIV